LGGAMTLTKNGPGTLVVSNTTANDYDGQMTISGGTLKAGIATALGATNGGTVINGGTLDVNGFNLGLETITIQGTGANGNGAIANSGGAQQSAISRLTLAGDATINSLSNRWDVYNPGGGYLAGNGHTLTKIGTPDLYLKDAGDTALGNVVIAQGLLGFQGNISMGFAASNVVVYPGATLAFWAVTNYPLNKVLLMTNGTIFSGSGTNVFVGPVTLGGTNTVNAGSPLVLAGALGGSGGLVKIGASSLTLSNVTSYSGSTTVSNGILALSASTTLYTSPTVALASPGKLDVTASGSFSLGSAGAQTLRGNGTIDGSLAVGGSGTVVVGFTNAIGTLTVTNDVNLGGATYMELNRTNVLSGTNDQIASATVTLGGSLTVTNIGSALHAGDTFKLFKASGTLTGSFSAVNLATRDANNMAYTWTDNTFVDGSITVLTASSLVNTTPTNITVSVSGNQLTLSWPLDHTGWRLQVQTNSIDVGLRSNWVDVANSTATNLVNVPISGANGSVFYRMVYP